VSELWVQVVSFLPNFFGALGVWMVGHKWRSGFLVGAASQALWVWLCFVVTPHLWSLLPWSAVWAVLYMNGWRRWGRADK
jgi:hypothetical protein